MIYNEQDRNRAIVAGVHAAIEPFVVPNTTTIEYVRQIYNPDTIVVEIPGLSDDYICKIPLDPFTLNMANSDEVINYIVGVVFAHFQLNPRVESESNIILGEN